MRTVKILCWNPRGLGKPREFRTLRELINKEDPNLVFLQETKVKASYFSAKKFMFGYSNGLRVGCEGKSGGLAVMWKEDINFEILQFLSHHIHGTITSRTEGGTSLSKWSVTGVYGHLEVNWRKKV